MNNRVITWLTTPIRDDDVHKVAKRKKWEVIDEITFTPMQDVYFGLKSLFFHWRERDFDILLVEDVEAIADSAPLRSYIIQRTIAAGAEIHTLAGRRISENNYHQWLSINPAQLETMKKTIGKGKWHEIYFELRVRKGIPAHRYVPDSHILIYDSDGIATGIELNSETYPMWQDLATLILEGLSWADISQAMFTRFGYANPQGKPYSRRYFYVMVCTPVFWGHTARNFKESRFGSWIYREGEPVPDNVTVYYSTHTPVWTGELAGRIKSELDRRSEHASGGSMPYGMFNDLLLCAECSEPLVLRVNDLWLVWICKNSTHNKTKMLTERNAKQYIDKRLKQLLQDADFERFLPFHDKSKDEIVGRIHKTKGELTAAQYYIDAIYDVLTAIDDKILDKEFLDLLLTLYLENDLLKDHLKILEQHLALLDKYESVYDLRSLAEQSRDNFWRLPEHILNELLHRLMGDIRFSVYEGEITGFVKIIPTQPTYEA